jgi:hypothetical protein
VGISSVGTCASIYPRGYANANPGLPCDLFSRGD